MNTFDLWMVVLLTCGCNLSGKCEEAILMDTRTATSDVGWTMSQGSMWQEVTSPHPDESDRRMLMVCEIHKPNQDNWVRTPYIPVNGARRLYVEFEFTIRSCEDVENVATCKETFNLYYYETDRDEATTTFPPWREDAYIKVDTIAADKRFRPGSHETNFETREIGPLKKRGVYLALQDTGACMALMHMRVYYKYCKSSTQNLAHFRRTIVGPEVTSLVETSGTCVRNAVSENGALPSLHCNGKGDWTVPKGLCVCVAGYSPDPTLTSCRACGRGQYKASSGNGPCTRCPANSQSREAAATICECMYGYLRAPLDDPTFPCTQTPSKPENLRAAVNQTTVTLNWDRPLNDGGRDDLTYRVRCSRCQFGFRACTSCPNDVDYFPAREGLAYRDVTIHDLSAFAYYKFKVYAVNGVSSVASPEDTDKSYAVVTIETSQAAPSAVLNVQVDDVTDHLLVVTWTAPAKTNGRIKQCEVLVTSVLPDANGKYETKKSYTTQDRLEVSGLRAGAEYRVKVRAQSAAGYGPYSDPVNIETSAAQTTAPPTGERSTADVNLLHLIAAIIGGCVFVIAAIVVYFVYRRKSRKFHSPGLDLEKFTMLRTSSLKYAAGGYNGSSLKTYIDPTTYEDPQRAVLDFTKEIDASYVAIEEIIGGGEFGEVCRGRTRLPCGKAEQEVAIKTLKSGYSTQQKLDFLGEASIMGQFDHPNVIRLEGVVTRSRPHMIITEFMENGSLDSFLRKHDGEFSVIQLVGMLRNISAGMKYLSDMGYVHRDLAARNILVNAQLICKVSDFGLSRVLEEDSDATYTTRGGKIPIRWTAPEAITYRKFTSASDVWSYGIVMWEVMSYGERPYWGMSNQDVIQAVGTGYRLPAPMDCPQVQHQLMLECWKKNRNERPKFGQIVSALDRMLREPSQLKAIAGNDYNSNDHLLNEHASLPSYSFHQDPDSSTLLLQPQPGYVVSCSTENLSSLGRWLDGLGMAAFKDNFTQNGCTSLEQVLQLSASDLTKFGIADVEHQTRLLNDISIRRANNYSRGEPPKYPEGKMSGIPV